MSHPGQYSRMIKLDISNNNLTRGKYKGLGEYEIDTRGVIALSEAIQACP